MSTDRSGVDEISAIGALVDPIRRRLYEYVVARLDAVGREEAAAAVGIPVHSARFHLDRLAEEGLLEVTHKRLSGRSGPGAGRPAKLYRRADAEVAVSLPERRYDLVGRVLAAAVRRSLDGAPLTESLVEEARAAGRRDGTDFAAGYAGSGDDLERSAAALTDRGFEPTLADDSVLLRNCPFDALAREHTELVCGVNRDYVEGVLDGLRCKHSSARLDPAAGRCCVRISREP